MGSEFKRIDFLLNRRAGIEEDFSVPDDVTVLRRTSGHSGRDVGVDDGSCDITTAASTVSPRALRTAAAAPRPSRTGRSAPSSSTMSATASS